MKKIRTIFDRDWEGNRKVVNNHVMGAHSEYLSLGRATEKLDGMNIRVTVRNHSVVRVEKRRNPSKIEKQKGIEEPWYIDADENAAADKWIYDAVRNTDLTRIDDGEWVGEAVGKNIQGNPLNLSWNVVAFLHLMPEFENVPTTYMELREWLPKQKSKFGNDCGIEGIVWHFEDGEMLKVKIKDFHYE